MAALPAFNIEDEEEIAKNPQLRTVRDFIADVLHRELKDLYAYDILIKNPESGYGEFSVRFGDGSTGYAGTIRQGVDGWHVHTFRAIMIVMGNRPGISEGQAHV